MISMPLFIPSFFFSFFGCSPPFSHRMDIKRGGNTAMLGGAGTLAFVVLGLVRPCIGRALLEGGLFRREPVTAIRDAITRPQSTQEVYRRRRRNVFYCREPTSVCYREKVNIDASVSKRTVRFDRRPTLAGPSLVCVEIIL